MQSRIIARIALTLALIIFLHYIPVIDSWLCVESRIIIRSLWGGFLILVTWRDLNKAITSAELNTADDLRRRWASRNNA